MFAPISTTITTIASNLGLSPPWRVRWYGFKTMWDNRGTAVSLTPRLGFLASTTEGLGYLFHVEAGATSEAFEFRLKFYETSKAESIFGAPPVLIKPTTDITIFLGSKATPEITNEDQLIVEHGNGYISIILFGSEVLRTSLPQSYVLDTLKTIGAFTDAYGSPVSITVLSIIDVEKPFDVSGLMPPIITIGVVASVIGAIMSLLIRLLR
jgi:hypothetical protein